MSVEVVWVFSLPRSGSSVTAYAAAAPFGVPVADEVFGPWDRTGTPYNYPRVQRELVRIYLEDQCYFTPRVLELAEELFEILGGRVGRVVVKHPHLRPFPHNFRETRPTDGAVWLLRNPLKRLNSLYARGWTEGLRPNHEIDHVRAFGNHYAWAPPHCRLRFEDLRKDPRAYFRRLYAAWGWDASERHIDAAVKYANETYHGNSAQTGHATGISLPTSGGRALSLASAPLVSDSAWCLPDEAIIAYRRDTDMRRMFREQGYSNNPSDYRSGGRLRDALVRLRGGTPARKPSPPPPPAMLPRAPLPAGVSRPGLRVCWVVGLPGNAMDEVASALGAASGVPVAREPFGPWAWSKGEHREMQVRLARLVDSARGVPTDEVIAAANQLLSCLAPQPRGHHVNGVNGTARATPPQAIIVTSRFQRLDPHAMLKAWPESRILYVVQSPRARLEHIASHGWPEAEDQDASSRRFKDMLFEIRRPRDPDRVSWIEVDAAGKPEHEQLSLAAAHLGLRVTDLEAATARGSKSPQTQRNSPAELPGWIETSLETLDTDAEYAFYASSLGLSTPR